MKKFTEADMEALRPRRIQKMGPIRRRRESYELWNAMIEVEIEKELRKEAEDALDKSNG